MWPRNDLIDLLQIEHPIIQAPMAGSTTPALASAVSNAGGLGSLGCASLPIYALREQADQLQASTNRAYNLNFFCHRQEDTPPEVEANARARVYAFTKGLGLAPPEAPLEPGNVLPFRREVLDVLLDVRPPVVSFHFGVPDQDSIAALKNAGCVLLCSATTVVEAKMLEQAGMDAIIAQGWEAGGHRGTFKVSYEDFGVGTMALVPQIVDAVSVPVVAAGGIADGRGIAAAFALGASGVQMGTAFMTCPESAVSDLHKKMIKQASDDETRLTRAFSGRPARARKTPYIEHMNAERTPVAAMEAAPGLVGGTGPGEGEHCEITHLGVSGGAFERADRGR